MRQPLPGFPPLFPPVEWWRIFLERRLKGLPRPEAIAEANSESGIRARDWMRVRIGGDERISIPVAGGASALKNRHPDTWRLAPEAVRESRKADATMATVYGRTPFYHLLGGEFRMLPEEGDPQELSAARVCCDAFRRMETLLSLDDGEVIKLLTDMEPQHKKIFKSLHKRNDVADSLSVIDAVARYGRDAIFTIIPSFKFL